MLWERLGAGVVQMPSWRRWGEPHLNRTCKQVSRGDGGGESVLGLDSAVGGLGTALVAAPKPGFKGSCTRDHVSQGKAHRQKRWVELHFPYRWRRVTADTRILGEWWRLHWDPALLILEPVVSHGAPWLWDTERRGVMRRSRSEEPSGSWAHMRMWGGWMFSLWFCKKDAEKLTEGPKVLYFNLH